LLLAPKEFKETLNARDIEYHVIVTCCRKRQLSEKRVDPVTSPGEILTENALSP
jgi:hypothetical protein